MKKLLAILLVLTVCFGASAKFRWGPSVGGTFTTIKWKQDLVQSQMLAGYNVGLIGELMIPGIGFGIDFGLKYNWRGGRVHFGDQKIWESMGIGTEDVRFHTLQIPINLRFKWTRMNGVENYIAPFVFGGPVFNFNLATTKCDAIEHPAGSVGLACGIGGEIFKRYQIWAGYQWDVTYDIRTKKLDNFSGHVDGWFVNAAVLF